MNHEVCSPRIVYAEEDFAVVVKLAGEICESNAENECDGFSLAWNVKPLLEKKLQKKISFCQCVHRLDRPVCGLCLVALCPDSFVWLSSLFAGGKVRKTYLAVAEKPAIPLENKKGILSCHMVFDKRKQKAFITTGNTKGARQAVMSYQILGEGERYVFVQAQPKTGRTHQIRCQLAKIGLHIKGDVKYGAKRTEANGGIRLCAWKLAFENPKTKKTMEFESLPPVMDSLWKVCFDVINGCDDGKNI